MARWLSQLICRDVRLIDVIQQLLDHYDRLHDYHAKDNQTVVIYEIEHVGLMHLFDIYDGCTYLTLLNSIRFDRCG